MPYDLVIMDFDGTFTDVEREAVPFLAHYRQGLAKLLGKPVDGVWERAVTTVRAEPDRHGFRYGERIVAPSHADPYILASCVSRLVLEAAGRPALEGLEDLFHQSYAHADTVFRPDAREVAQAVVALDAPAYVVSNSRRDNVVRKLGTLDPALLAELVVQGDARKFELVTPEPTDERFEALPESLDLEEPERPLYLRRGRYYETLRSIWATTGTTPERTLVCGDIFELDLALPASLGADVHLVGRPSTPPWERDAVTHVGGTFGTDLSAVLARL